MTRDLWFPPISALTRAVTVTDVHVLRRRVVRILPVAMVTGCSIISREALMVVVVLVRRGVVFRPVTAVVMMMMMIMLVTAAGQGVAIWRVISDGV